jgi:hypothetical protein
MQKVIGVICLIIGVLLIIKGHDVGKSIASQFKETFTGAPLDRSLQLYLAGAGAGVLGLLLIFWKQK